MVEPLLVFLYGLVAPGAHIAQHGIDRGLQLCDVQVRTLADLCPLFLFGIFDNLHLNEALCMMNDALFRGSFSQSVSPGCLVHP